MEKVTFYILKVLTTENNTKASKSYRLAREVIKEGKADFSLRKGEDWTTVNKTQFHAVVDPLLAMIKTRDEVIEDEA